MDFTTTAIDGFSVAGTTFSVDGANDRIGIGTAAPSEKLEITGNVAFTKGADRSIAVRQATAGGEAGYDLTIKAGDASFSGSEAAGGDLILMAGQQHDADASDNNASNVIIRAGYNNLGGGLSNNEGEVRFFTNNQERMQIQSNGNVGIGVTNPSVKLQVAGDVTISGKFNSQGIEELSDVRYKKNIEKLNGALENVLKIQGVTYNWRQDEFPERSFGSQTEIGFIAQELEKIYPELVNTNIEGYKSVQYSHMVPVLLEAIKEQQSQISLLQNNIDQLYSELSSSQNDYSLLKVQLNEMNERIESLFPIGLKSNQ
jgi:hypothetical protein